MTLTIDHNNYLQLWAEVNISPKVIETEIEYRQFLAVAESLLVNKNLRTPEETTLFQLVVKLIEDYESEHYNLARLHKNYVDQNKSSQNTFAGIHFGLIQRTKNAP